jgi:hypothetical protein
MKTPKVFSTLISQKPQGFPLCGFFGCGLRESALDSVPSADNELFPDADSRMHQET